MPRNSNPLICNFCVPTWKTFAIRVIFWWESIEKAGVKVKLSTVSFSYLESTVYLVSGSCCRLMKILATSLGTCLILMWQASSFRTKSREPEEEKLPNMTVDATWPTMGERKVGEMSTALLRTRYGHYHSFIAFAISQYGRQVTTLQFLIKVVSVSKGF